ncbi:MAG: zinc-binding dehydrogenase [Bacteroidales bacterium]|nr:MAG: zinc-binding dehydrogenase [Bacteroidales bacterium]
MVKSLGTDKVTDYTKEDFTRTGEICDIVFDVVGKSSFPKCRRILKKEGYCLSTELTLSIPFHILRTSLDGGKKARFQSQVPLRRKIPRQ